MLMRNIGSGMRPGSLQDVGLLFGVLAVLFILSKVYYSRLAAHWRNRRISLSDRKFLERANELGLLPSDRALLHTLAARLTHPDQQKHSLLEDPVQFDSVRRSYLEEHPFDHERVLALRVRLDFPSRGSGRALESTAELPVGTLLFPVEERTDASGPEEERAPLFLVREILPAALRVEILRESFPGGLSFHLEIQRPDGHYRFSTFVIETNEGFAWLAHAFRMERRQNRRYVRRDVTLNARCDRHPVRIVNLGGGGACLQTSRGFLRDTVAGDLFALTFDLPGATIKTTARVVKIELERGLLRIGFTRIRESDRDRIIKFILTSGPDQPNPPRT